MSRKERVRPERFPFLVQHYKGGIYMVLGEAVDANNEEAHLGPLVLYYALADHRYFVRRDEEFWGYTQFGSGHVARFRVVDEEDVMLMTPGERYPDGAP